MKQTQSEPTNPTTTAGRCGTVYPSVLGLYYVVDSAGRLTIKREEEIK